MSKSSPKASDPSAKASETHGHCLCGAIEYAFSGKPVWTAHCHCESCRRATSAAFATYVGVKLEQFNYMKGEPTFYESSPGVKRYFCATCGSPLAFVGDKWAGEIHLHAGSLDDPVAIAPTGHMNTTEQVPWGEVHDQLPRYAQYSHGATPTRKGPKA